MTSVLPKKTTNTNALPDDASRSLAGRLVALDPGEKRVGVAISDEIQLTVRPLKTLQRTSWKKFLSDIKELLAEFDAKALVIGLPLSLDGVERSSAIEVRRLANKLSLSLDVRIFLQDERLTSREAEESLRESGYKESEIEKLIDSWSAAIVLRDFINDVPNRVEVSTLGPDRASTT